MKTKKMWYVFLLGLIVASLLVASCGPATEEAKPTEAPKATEVPAAEQVTIAFSGFSSTNEFWLTLARAAEAKAGELGVNFVNVTTEVQDAEAQKAAVDTAITQGVDAIIVGAADSRGWDDSFNKAKEAGIPIITVDTGIEHDWVSTLIQTDNLAAATAAGEWIVDQTGGEGKALVLGGSVGHQTGDARKNGVQETLEAAGMEVIGDWSDWDENKSAELTQNALTANPDINVVFVAFDPGAVAALSVIRDKGMVDQITLVGFDGLPVALKAIKAGEMEASMAQNPARMGAEGVELALKVINGEEVPDFIPIDGVLITADNVDEFLKDEGGEEPPAAGKKPEDMTVAFSGFSSTNEFWLTLARAAEAKADEMGVKFVNVTTEVQDAEAQKAAVDTAITQGVDAIIVGAADSRGWDDSFNKAKEAGIPIITVDTGIEHDWVSTLIQTDNLAAAKAAGEWIVEQTGGEGKALVLGGSVGHQTGDARKNGVQETLEAAGMEVIGDWSDWDENKSAELTQNALTANPDINVVFVAFDPGAVAALSIIRDKGMVDQITLVGFDGLPVALKAIKAGEMEASMAQNPARMGAEGLELAVKVVQGEEVPEFIPIDGVLITQENVDEFLEGGEEPPAGAKKPEDMTIAFSGFSSTNEFWLTLARAAEAKAGEMGVKFVNVTTEVQDAEAQKAAVDTAITQGVDAIIVGAADSRGWDDSFNKAKEAGIPIITVDTGIEHDWVSTLIQTDNLAAAKAAGEWIVAQTGGEGKALVLGGSVGHQTGDARKNGVQETLEAAGMEVIGDWSDWDENKSAELTQNALTANPDINVVFVAFDPGAVAALSIIRDKGMVDQITLVGFDGLPVALKAIKAGEMAASMAQNPARMGAEGLELAVKVVQGMEVPDFIPIDGVLITIDNVDEFLTE